ncbi:50S ribosomal protein L18 [Spiribacter sp. C176]|uniref:Large ribosomal subunit protein uL18 n=1 Tax=Spiribacter salilacus TaxID=2664894 RepID=A0A6N7QT21_9GAMM|nr:50S ribosomal protein L18 [Spiribacter salilacus]MBS3785461.1 50S ribosomal protein L18 [Gammaproteobacteria bacterium]MRH78559.1 50S ribosomal protein L18 [Spiribacter salilacus]
MDKKSARQRRARKSRAKMRELGSVRLTIHRTPRHTYAQVITADATQTVAAASTLEKSVRGDLAHGGNIEAARAVGQAIAERAVAAGITEVAFDRAGFKYHGRVQAIADAAREAGLKF